MPRYEYLCPDCKRIFEVTRKMDEVKSTEVCPGCAGTAKRKFSVPHIAKFIVADPQDPEQWR